MAGTDNETMAVVVRARTRLRSALGLYILRNSGFRVWLADRLVAVAGRLNPARPWRHVRPGGGCAAGSVPSTPDTMGRNLR